MAANDDRIRLTVRVENPLYVKLRDHCFRIGATHNRVVEKAIAAYLDHNLSMKDRRRRQMA
jgi:hypothetical protein